MICINHCAATDSSSAMRSDRYAVSVEQYRTFRRNGFLVVRGLVGGDDIAELRKHTEDLMRGCLPEQQAIEDARDVGSQAERDGLTPDSHVQATLQLDKPPAELSPEEKAQYFLRIHMLHRKLALHERYMLHSRVLDVLEVLIGPDVLALQTMLFLKPPGKPGQGWHQDSYYIPTHPDTLCAAWIAIDDCDERNGAMWFARGSNIEPIYPPCPNEAGDRPVYGFGDTMLKDVRYVKGVSNTDDAHNMLTQIADRYDQTLVSANAGDVVFFNGHVLHRSKQNWTTDRFRRAFVGHYCNARSFVQWGADMDADNVHAAPAVDPVTHATNASHILARGDTNLDFAQPRFGTPCAATEPAEQRRHYSEYVARMMAEMNHGLMGCAIMNPNDVSDND